MSNLPVACTLSTEALQVRREGLLSRLLARAEHREVFPEGFRARFAPDDETLALIAMSISAERHCCRFLRFQVVVEPDGGPIWLELSGPSGTGDFLAALIES